MTIKKQIVYPKIGVVNYKYRKGSKRITLRVKKEGSVHVTIPYLVKFSHAENFVLSKRDWIITKLNEVEKRNKPITFFECKFHIIRIIPTEHATEIVVKQNGNELIILHPNTISHYDKNLQSFLKHVITETLRKEAKEYLPKRLEVIAKQNNFKYGKVTVRNSKTRWGSCSSKNNISLSLWLMTVPNHLIDYVIFHELCHTLEKNHGNKFWQLLDNFCEGKAKQLSKELKRYPIPF